jgi:hypothetical protein
MSRVVTNFGKLYEVDLTPELRHYFDAPLTLPHRFNSVRDDDPPSYQKFVRRKPFVFEGHEVGVVTLGVEFGRACDQSRRAAARRADGNIIGRLRALYVQLNASG